MNGWQGGPGLQTSYFLATTVGGTVAEATIVANRVRASFAAAAGASGLWPSIWNAQVSAAVDLLNDATGALVASFSVPLPAIVAGANGTTFGAATTAVPVVWGTSVVLAGRRLVGRTFLSPVSATFLGNLIPPPAAGTQALLFANSMIGTVGTTPNPLMVWHRPKLGGGGVSAVATTATSPQKWFVLRSRRD